MRWAVIFYVGAAFWATVINDSTVRGIFWMTLAILFVLMEIADNTKARRRNQ